MIKHRAPSPAARLLLTQLLKGPQYGYGLMKETGVKSGTLYPILMRLTDRDLLTTNWETSETPGRPPRQLYALTAEGRRYASEVLSPKSPKSPQAALGVT